MEATAAALPLVRCFSSSPLFRSSSLVASSTTTSLPFQCSNIHLQLKQKQQTRLRGVVVRASTSDTQVPLIAATGERWLLEPVGDGDTKHIGYKVQMPNAIEITSNVVTVGRLPEKADCVIPVATVSGVHARIRKKDGNLLVTDLDSTNGTFVDDQRLRPGVVAILSPGSCVTFGDEHLAVFRVSKLENVEAASNSEPSKDEVETVIPSETSKTI